MHRQVAIDTETTGLHVHEGHRVIEIGCVEIIDGRITGRELHRLVNPEREIEPSAFAVHGITQGHVRDKPLFSQIWPELNAFLAGADLIIHNAPFDLGFLNAEIKRCAADGAEIEKLEDRLDVIDTVLLARQLRRDASASLNALCKRYGVDNRKRAWHEALTDARLLAKVYIAMKKSSDVDSS
jgi:DNA polymerase III subunit epsilon